MNTLRLTFNSSTNLTLPIGTYEILRGDAEYYGYVKNNKPNISGFLNDLIPELSDYQKDLYENLLEYNGENDDIAKAVARSIHNVYLRPFAFHDDGVTNVPFRINRNRYEDFITIHDEHLSFYDTDFTKYVRTLLVEYASKTLTQREYLYAFRMIKLVREGIANSFLCKFYTKNTYESFVPVSIEASSVYDHNFIVGMVENGSPIAVRLCDVQRVMMTNKKIEVTEEACDRIADYLDAVYDEEYNECLD